MNMPYLLSQTEVRMYSPVDITGTMDFTDQMGEDSVGHLIDNSNLSICRPECSATEQKRVHFGCDYRSRAY